MIINNNNFMCTYFFNNISYARTFFKKHFFNIPFLVMLTMILKLNIKLYSSKNSLFLMKLYPVKHVHPQPRTFLCFENDQKVNLF